MSTKEITLDWTSEPILLAMIDEYSRLPGKNDDRYWQLRGRRENETLTDAESVEYELLIKEWETRNVERVRALIALAKKRDTTLHGVMAQLRFNPKYTFPYFQRGLTRNALGQSKANQGNKTEAQQLYQAAIDDYTEAININPKNVNAYNNRGIVKKALGQHEAAEKDFEKAKMLKSELTL